MTSTVRVGVTVAEDRVALAATRRFLRLHTPPDVEVRQLHHRGALAFNELVERSGAAVTVLLEAGALPGPGWLDHLLRALQRPGCGLAGPSTNRSWNEQGCVDRAGGDLTGVRRESARLALRFGPGARSLAPLHSLGAFCYAVRREVVVQLGPADPAYGEGPCWEMDYNVRAARAGFTGLWVGAAYVYRPPAGARAEQEERPLLERNRRIYQDRLCGLRLAGSGPPTPSGYRDHCVGDDCAHFAPQELLGPRRDPGPVVKRPVGTVGVEARWPLVSCLMVTRDRPDFALQAVRLFQRQDYPNLELVIVEDGTPALAGKLPRDPRIRLLSTGRRRSIGAMRNQSCELARGEVLVLWDDDDWHAPGRVSRQVTPILAGAAAATGLTDVTWLEVAPWRSWRLDEALQRVLLLDRVYAGTLAFHRRVWGRVGRFAHRSLAEDAAFLRAVLDQALSFEHVDGSDLYVYVRHGSNSWAVDCGRSVDPGGWRPSPLPDLSAEYLTFLEAQRRPAPASTPPLVSCIMPTADRREHVARAVRFLARQTHPATELVVVDDGLDPVEDLVADVPGVVYRRLSSRVPLGAKRNLAVELGHGELIAHWDDDDWYPPERLERQLALLTAGRAELVGASWLDFYEPEHRRAWRYRWPEHRRPWLAGTSLLYRRGLWARNRFAEVASGEDTRFVWRTPASAVAVTSDPQVVAIVHRGNTAPKTGRGAYWSALDPATVEAVLGSDLDSYRSGTTLVEAT